MGSQNSYGKVTNHPVASVYSYSSIGDGHPAQSVAVRQILHISIEE